MCGCEHVCLCAFKIITIKESATINLGEIKGKEHQGVYSRVWKEKREEKRSTYLHLSIIFLIF